MSDRTELYRKFNPHAIAEFRDFRGVERLLIRDPVVQQRGLTFLIGMYTLQTGNFNEKNNSEELAEAMKSIIKDYIDRFPECLEPQDNDNELQHGPYKPDPNVLAALESLFRET